MYLTVHHVRRGATESQLSLTGFNGFAYLHEDKNFELEFSTEDVAQQAPGRLVSKQIELRPGGNFVDSYLDVLAPDSTTPEELSELFTSLRSKVPEGVKQFSNVWKGRDWALRLSVSERVGSVSIGQEFENLTKRAIAIWRRTDTVEYTITQSEDLNSFRFGLQGYPERAQVQISSETLEAFEHYGGNFYQVLPPLLLSESELEQAPRVRVVDENRNLIWSSES